MYSLQVAKALKELCGVVAIVSSYAENLRDWRISGLRVLEVPTYTTIGGVVFSTVNLARHLRIVRWMREAQASVVYYPMLHPWAPILNSLTKGIPRVVTVHDPIRHVGEQSRILDALQMLSIRQAARVIVLNHSAAAILSSRGVDARKIDVVPHGEFSFYRRTAVSLTSARDCGDGARVLFFGRILPYKGLGTLLEAFQLVKEKVPHARLDVVGHGDLRPYRRQLEILGDSVRVVNRWIPDDEVDDYFRVADVVVLPYIEASQSGVIAIAYSYGLPVIASDVGGLAEQVVDGQTGLLVPPGDVAALASACIQLLTNPLLRKKLGEAGYEKATTEWSWKRVALGVYESLRRACA